ncbi:Neural ectodermal development factor, partial [Blomia tropicalis]
VRTGSDYDIQKKNKKEKKCSNDQIQRCIEENGFMDHDSMHLDGSNHLDGRFDDYIVREVRKDNSKNTKIQPYLSIRSAPPVELSLPENSKYVLECSISGTPKPNIVWLKNDKFISQGDINASADESSFGQLGLSSVKSRLFLDCVTQADHGTTYTCMAVTKHERKYATTKLTVRPQSVPIESSAMSKELELFGNQNGIEMNKPSSSSSSSSSGGSSSDINTEYNPESALIGCMSKKSLGSPARIYFWTETILESIGSDAIIHCHATGFPKPTHTWYDSENNKIVSNERMRILANGDLLISNVSFGDMGVYRCVASNQYGSDQLEKAFLYPTAPERD